MLKQILNTEFTSSDVMLGIIIILGVIVMIKFGRILLIIVFTHKSENEPVFKNLIKKSDDVEHLPR